MDVDLMAWGRAESKKRATGLSKTPHADGIKVAFPPFSGHSYSLTITVRGAEPCIGAVTEATASPVAGTIKPASTPISDSVRLWLADMERRGCKATSRRHAERYVQGLIANQAWVTVGDVNLPGAVAYLNWKRAGGWSGPTHDQAVSFMRVWTKYLHRAGVLPKDVLEHLEGSGDQGNEGSRALTIAEARALVAAGLEAQRNGDGRRRGDRALFYVAACLTGLRVAELSSLLWKDIDLEGSPRAIYTAPERAKNGRRMRVCLNAEMLDVLELQARCVPQGREDLVFPRPPKSTTFADDRAAADIPYMDGRQRKATPHSMRKGMATWLDAAGVSPGLISRLLRHSENLAQERYIDPNPAAELEAVSKLPRLLPEGWDGSKLRAVFIPGTGDLVKKNLRDGTRTSCVEGKTCDDRGGTDGGRNLNMGYASAHHDLSTARPATAVCANMPEVPAGRAVAGRESGTEVGANPTHSSSLYATLTDAHRLLAEAHAILVRNAGGGVA